jgi:hypothetical protein
MPSPVLQNIVQPPKFTIRDSVAQNAIDSAGRWLLHSGIQSPSGGVARYCHLAGVGNLPVSNEITGYTLSAFVFLYEQTGEMDYRRAAEKTANFLLQEAWRPGLETFPFENSSPVPPAYFFDCGIIVRGLLAYGHQSQRAAAVEVARQAAGSMARDFLTPSAIHPIVALPSRQALPYGDRWSNRPGCFLLKSAVAWYHLGGEFSPYFETALAQALANWRDFLPTPGSPAALEAGTMDRLHAFSYFLEALLFVGVRPEARAALAEGLQLAATLRDGLAARFARSDVYAQILRVRLWAGDLGLPVDRAAADAEYEQVLSFRDFRPDPRAEGGFYFGRRDGVPLPFSNPVSTAFCLQAVALYAAWNEGRALPPNDRLI